MARKRKSYGLVKHSGKKIKNLFWKNYHTPSGRQPEKVVHARIYVQRAARPTNTGRTAGYYAHACIGKHGANFRKCGPDEFGRTPTAAVKKALVALGRDSRVR
jgi:hypothetical protein